MFTCLQKPVPEEMSLRSSVLLLWRKLRAKVANFGWSSWRLADSKDYAGDRRLKEQVNDHKVMNVVAGNMAGFNNVHSGQSFVKVVKDSVARFGHQDQFHEVNKRAQNQWSEQEKVYQIAKKKVETLN